MGYQANMTYGHTYWHLHQQPIKDTLNHPGDDSGKAINFSANKEFLLTHDQIRRNGFFITLGGPLQTMLTGTIGFILLLIYRNSFKNAAYLKIGQWTIIFTTLFWLRQPVNLFSWIIRYLIRGNFSHGGDEIGLAYYLHLPSLSVIGITGAIGIGILSLILFKFVPVSQRFTFLIAGLIGGGLGLVPLILY